MKEVKMVGVVLEIDGEEHVLGKEQAESVYRALDRMFKEEGVEKKQRLAEQDLKGLAEREYYEAIKAVERQKRHAFYPSYDITCSTGTPSVENALPEKRESVFGKFANALWRI